MAAEEIQDQSTPEEFSNKESRDVPIEDVTEILSHLSPEDLAKFKLFDHKFNKVVEKVQSQREYQCLSSLKKISGVEKERNPGPLTKIYETCTSLLQRSIYGEEARLKICSPHITGLNLSIDPAAVENPDPILIELARYCHNIEDLNLNSCSITTEGINALQNLKNLRFISLCFCDHLTLAELQEVGKLVQLKKLKICWNRSIPEGAIETLLPLTDLETLNLSHTNITDDDLAYVNQFTKLTALYCDDCPNLTDKGIESLSGLKHLKTFSISSPMITDAGFKKIVELFPELTSLTLRNQNFSDKTLMEIKHLKCLKDLNLSWSHGIEGEILHALAQLPELQILDLSHSQNFCPFTRRWRKFPSLMVLHLSYCLNNDAVLSEVSKIPLLSNISLAYSDSISLRGIQQLTRCEHLRFLDIVFCGLEEDQVRPLFSENVEIRI